MEANIIVQVLSNGVVLGLAAFILHGYRKRFETNEKKSDEISKEIKEVKTNYLDRFERLNKNLSDFREETNVTLTRIETKLNLNE